MKIITYSSVTVTDVIDNSIASVDVMYYLSTSNTECVGGTWSTTPPPWEDGKYYWQKTVTVFTDTSKPSSETKPVCITGGKGNEGRGVVSISEEYYLSTSKESPVGGTWSEERPQWSYGKYIWTRSKITYKNPDGVEYTTPVCDASWEIIDNVEIGGKNLLKNTSSMIAYDSEKCNWTLDSNGTVSINETDKATDARHIKTSNATDANSGLLSVITDIDFYHRETYTFSTAIRGTFDLSKTFGAQIYYRNTAGKNVYSDETKTSWVDNGDGINDGIHSTNFQRRYFTFTIPEDFDESFNYLAVNIYCATMDIYVRNFQLERGNKPTDWGVADDDFQSQIDSVTSTMSGVSSKVDQVSQQITNKVWVTDINNYIDNYDKSTVQVISKKQTEQQQTIDGIQSTVSSMETTLSTKADGSTVTELTNRVAKAEQDVTGFKQTVEETYATKDENKSVRTYAEQLADKFNWVVTSNSSSTSLTLTDKMISAITNQFVIKSPDGKRVVIEDGLLKSDFLQSLNYQAGTGTPLYSSAGTFIDMSNGAIYSKNFVIDKNGSAYFKGTVYATNGSFTGDIIANSLTLGSNVKIDTDNISGLSSVATTGNYDSLSNKPDLTIYFQKDHTLGTVANGSTGIKISSSGLLQASNAVIYGTVYASAGSFAGSVTATSGKIGDCTIVNGKLTVPAANITGTLTASQIGAGAITADKIASNAITSDKVSAGAITANKISVSDLSALGATIGGFKLNSVSIYSENKTSVSSEATGIYLDKNGQMAIGDGTNYIKYYKGSDSKYHLAISADELVMSTGTRLEVFLGQLSQSIDDASKVATNFLGFDSNGIVVGDRTKEVLGKNVMIDSDSVDIRDGSNVLASFAANQIDLGKNNQNAKITLCNNLATMEAKNLDENYDSGLYIHGNVLGITARDYIRTNIIPTDAINYGSYAYYDDGDGTGIQVGYAGIQAMHKTHSAVIEAVAGNLIGDAILLSSERIQINAGQRMDLPDCSVLSSNNDIIGHVQLRYSGNSPNRDVSFVGYEGSYEEGGAAKYFNAVVSYDGTMACNTGFKSNGIIEKFQNQVLWSGAYWPNGSQTCTLSQAISNQPHGIVLVFSNYSGSAQNTRFHCFFVAKQTVASYGGSGHQFNMFSSNFSQVCGKYLYISNTSIKGHDDNTKTGTGSSGIKYANNTFVLRTVIGV